MISYTVQNYRKKYTIPHCMNSHNVNCDVYNEDRKILQSISYFITQYDYINKMY